MKSVWLLDLGADVHVMTIDEWERLEKPELIESNVVWKTASGEDLEAVGKIKVRGFLAGERVEFQAILATKVQVIAQRHQVERRRVLSCDGGRRQLP